LFFTITPAFAETVTIDFDSVNTDGGNVSGAAVESYLAGFGISISDNGSVKSDFTITNHPNDIRVFPVSSPNFFYRGWGNEAYSYTISFETPLDKFEFTRTPFDTRPSGIAVSPWNAEAFSSNGNSLGVVGEGSMSYFSDPPSATFSFNGPDIAKVTFYRNSENTFAGIAQVPLDNFVLTIPNVSVDSDGDGVNDGDDGCPNDPNKTAPGSAGCGVAEPVDSDGDGVNDGDDGCPNDPNKTAPGIGGCGVSDVDSDGDGVIDSLDGCPNDPNKTTPPIYGGSGEGTCGYVAPIGTEMKFILMYEGVDPRYNPAYVSVIEEGRMISVFGALSDGNGNPLGGKEVIIALATGMGVPVYFDTTTSTDANGEFKRVNIRLEYSGDTILLFEFQGDSEYLQSSIMHEFNVKGPDPQFTVGGMIELGNQRNDEENYDVALNYFNEALGFAPNNLDALWGKSYSLFYLGRYNDEIQVYNKILEIEPYNIDALFGKALAYRDLGEFDSALDVAHDALAVYPNDSDFLELIEELEQPTSLDTDGDGIADSIDGQDSFFSQFFTDGITSGTITSGQEFLTITDVPGSGIRITSTGPATVSACGIASISFVVGESIVICGSITIEVISGTVDVTPTNIEDGPTITLGEGDNLTFNDQTRELTNNLDTNAIIFINSQQTTITSGSSVNLDAFIDSGDPIDDESVPTFFKLQVPDGAWTGDYKGQRTWVEFFRGDTIITEFSGNFYFIVSREKGDVGDGEGKANIKVTRSGYCNGSISFDREFNVLGTFDDFVNYDKIALNVQGTEFDYIYMDLNCEDRDTRSLVTPVYWAADGGWLYFDLEDGATASDTARDGGFYDEQTIDVTIHGNMETEIEEPEIEDKPEPEIEDEPEPEIEDELIPEIDEIIVEIKDPNPKLIGFKGELINNVDTAAAISILRVGTVADGISKLLLVAESKDPLNFSFVTSGKGTGTLGKLGQTGPGTSSIKVQPVNGKVVAVYTPPDAFGKSIDWIHSPRDVNIKVSNPSNSNVTPVEVSLKLHRPPVILVHGVWTTPDASWVNNGFSETLDTQGFNVFRVDYGGKINSAKSFDPKLNPLPMGILKTQTTIETAIDSYHNMSIAAAQVDVVGHSMGGLMTRGLIQQTGYENKSDFFEGTVHRLITINTPHLGANGAIPMTDKENKVLRKTFTTKLDSDPTLGAADALRPCSDALKHLTDTAVPSHAIVTTYQGGAENIATTFEVGINALLLEKRLPSDLTYYIKLDDLYGEPKYDLVVGYTSQKGGLDGLHVTSFNGLIHSVFLESWKSYFVFKGGDKGATSSSKVQERVIFLLTTDDDKLFAKKFLAPSKVPFFAPKNIKLDCPKGWANPLQSSIFPPTPVIPQPVIPQPVIPQPVIPQPVVPTPTSGPTEFIDKKPILLRSDLNKIEMGQSYETTKPQNVKETPIILGENTNVTFNDIDWESFDYSDPKFECDQYTCPPHVDAMQMAAWQKLMMDGAKATKDPVKLTTFLADGIMFYGDAPKYLTEQERWSLIAILAPGLVAIPDGTEFTVETSDNNTTLKVFNDSVIVLTQNKPNEIFTVTSNSYLSTSLDGVKIGSFEPEQVNNWWDETTQTTPTPVIPQPVMPQPVVPTPSPVTFSVDTDRTTYNQGNLVTIIPEISGVTSNANIAISVIDPSGNTVMTRSLFTDDTGLIPFKISHGTTSGSYKVTASVNIDGQNYEDTSQFTIKKDLAGLSIKSVSATDQQGNLVDSFSKGNLGYIKIVLSADSFISDSLVTVTVLDSDLTALGTSSIKTPISSADSEIILSFYIPDDTSAGNANIYVNAFTDWPSNGGVPLTREGSTEIGIGVSTTPWMEGKVIVK